MDIYIKAREIFCQIMEVSSDTLPEEITPDTVGNWDSLRHLNLILALENEFSIEFDEDEIDDLLSLDAFVRSINHSIA